MTSKNIEYLQEHGPSTSEELPADFGTTQRIQGMRRFKITGHGGGPGDTLGGVQRLVYYLPEHDPEAALRRYLEANPQYA
jgi:hypothetical protein